MVATPFDKRLAEINREMADTTLVYGDKGKKDGDFKKVEEAKALPAAPAADRAAFGGKGGRAASYDLLDSIKEKRVKLEDLKEEQLPKELQGMTLEKRKEFLDKLDKKRAELNQEAVDLDRKRSDFIQKKLTEDKKDTKDSFDTQVLEVLRKQAKKHKIDY